jgi:D-cysteine desulfhydrase
MQRETLMTSGGPALFRAFPQLAERVSWVALGRFPTRVERVRGLLPDSVELWVKREDESGGPYGGNKVRKLELLLAEARAAGAKRVATVGGIGSNHVLATAIYARALGLEAEAVLFPQPLTDHVRRQLLAYAAAGVRFRPTRSIVGVPFATLAARLGGARWIPGGGSSVTGTLGFVSAAYELREQIAAGELPTVDVVYAALGSCGTVAGLAAGFADTDVEVVGVRVVDRAIANLSRTRSLAHAALRRIGVKHKVGGRLRIDHTQFGGLYGRATPAAEEAVARAADVGLHLETTYTGKALAALLADARSGRLDGKRVLFLHSYSSADLAPLLADAPPATALPPLLARCFPKALGSPAR